MLACIGRQRDQPSSRPANRSRGPFPMMKRRAMRDEIPALLLNQVTKSYGTGPAAVHALRGVDLRLDPGRLIMLAGPSGCGKTTLMSIICGLLKPNSGNVEIFGHCWSSSTEEQKTRWRGSLVGTVFQKYHLIPTISILENDQSRSWCVGCRGGWRKAECAGTRPGRAQRPPPRPSPRAERWDAATGRNRSA